jgi:threonine/homoserine/homoserine lactone efflux protein
MPLETFLALVLFAFTTSITPGPNNMMLFASGVHFCLGLVWGLAHCCMPFHSST